MSLFKELKRRNVFRVATAYIVIGWLLLQVATTLTPALHLPQWIVSGIALLLILGFIPAILFSWAFELTPEGIKKDGEVGTVHSDTSQTAKKLDAITLFAVAGVVGLFVYQQVNPNQPVQSDSPSDARVLNAVSSKNQINVIADAENAISQANSSLEASSNANADLVLGVAVLPFVNMSANESNAFFASGVHEDVLTQLSYIRKLRIISRTSMEKVAEQGMEVREIGSHLGVSHVLEGSVRRAGEQVRVTVQLIDASTDEHVWAENFDRKLNDIFAIQSEIAEKIAAQLRAELTPEEVKQIERIPTTSNEAYDLFVKARELRRVWRGANTFKDMLPLLEQALNLDPNFLKAQVMITEVYGRLVWTGSDPTGQYKIKAKETLDEILQQHPNSIEAANAYSQYLYTVEVNYAASLREINKVLEAFPNDTEALLRAASCYKRLNNFSQGLPLIKKAASLDPEHAAIAGEVSLHLVGSGQYKQAYLNDQINILKFPEDKHAKAGLAQTGLNRFGLYERYKVLMQELNLKTEELYRQFGIQLEEMLLTPNTLDETMRELDSSDLNHEPFNAAMINLDIANLLNTLGRETESQQRAQKALEILQDKSVYENFISFREKASYARFAYAACLANDKEAFNRYESLMQNHKANEYKEGLLDYARAIAECGDITLAWKMLFEEANSDGLNRITPWMLALNPIYQYYFSELPEYQKMVAELEANKEDI